MIQLKILNIGKNFHNNPSGRFYSDGPGNGEEFREEYLKVALSELTKGEKLQIVLDDEVEGYGSSFLTEGFAGLVKYGYMKKDELKEKIDFTYSDQDFEFYKNKILQYIEEANYASEAYEPTQKNN